MGGRYVLASVGGADVALAPGPLPGCSQPGALGRLDISAGTPAMRPTYMFSTWDVPGVAPIEDIGNWEGGGSALRFTSLRGGAAYDVAVGYDGSVRRLTFTRAGAEYVFQLAPSSVTRAGVGYLSVVGVDASGAIVVNLAFQARDSDGLPYAGIAPHGQPHVTSGPAGAWDVTFQPPSGYALAPGQSARVCATVMPREITELRVVLAPVGG